MTVSPIEDPAAAGGTGWRDATFQGAVASLLRGDLAGTEHGLARLTRDQGQTPSLLWLRARLQLARRDGAAALRTLRRQGAMPALTEAQRAESELLAGLALDMIGDPAGAFAAAASGKARQRRLHDEEARRREGEVAKLRRVARWTAKAPPPATTPIPPPSRDAPAIHAFMLGFPRSGTTLLEQILAAHPAIDTLEEEGLLAAAYQAFLSDEAATDALGALGPREAVAWADHYWRDVRRRGLDVGGRVFVDKQPAGTVMLPVIARLFPQARVIFALRDPRDVVLSCFRQPFAMNAMTYAFTDLVETAWCYDACMTLAAIARRVLPLAWMDLRHEALIDGFDAVVADAAWFLGVDRVPAMADFAAATARRTIRTPSAAQVRDGINRRGVGRWQAYRAECAAIMPIVEPWVERLGYPAAEGSG